MDIKICDAIMGAGKTSAAINYMNDSQGKFIFIRISKAHQPQVCVETPIDEEDEKGEE